MGLMVIKMHKKQFSLGILDIFAEKTGEVSIAVASLAPLHIPLASLDSPASALRILRL